MIRSQLAASRRGLTRRAVTRVRWEKAVSIGRVTARPHTEGEVGIREKFRLNWPRHGAASHGNGVERRLGEYGSQLAASRRGLTLSSVSKKP